MVTRIKKFEICFRSIEGLHCVSIFIMWNGIFVSSSVSRQRAKLLFINLALILQHSLIFGNFATLRVQACTAFANSDISCVKSAS